MTQKRLLSGLLLQGGLGVLLLNAQVQAEPAKGGQDRPLTLASMKQDQPVVREKTTVTTTTTTTEAAKDSWEINGPVFLRSADPEPPGELIIKNIFGWEANKKTSGDDDNSEFTYEFEAEYGLVENHELIFAMPFEIGDGNAEGNGDVELGWHWRLWE